MLFKDERKKLVDRQLLDIYKQIGEVQNAIKKHTSRGELPVERKTMKFDPQSCSPSLALSMNNTLVTSQNGSYKSVIGEDGMNSGRQMWRFQLHNFQNGSWISLGVCSKGIPNQPQNYSQSYSWSSQRQRFPQGANSNMSTQWQVGDILTFLLDCEQHKLTIWNNRTQQLPSSSLFHFLFPT